MYTRIISRRDDDKFYPHLSDSEKSIFQIQENFELILSKKLIKRYTKVRTRFVGRIF